MRTHADALPQDVLVHGLEFLPPRVRLPPEIQSLNVQSARNDGNTRILRKKPRATGSYTQGDVKRKKTPERLVVLAATTYG